MDEFITRALQPRDAPDNDDAKRTAADALLEKRLGDGQFSRSPIVDSESRRDLETAERLLSEQWERSRCYDNADQDPFLTSGCNLVTLYRALQRPADARLIAAQLLGIAPESPKVLTVAAHAALDEEKLEEADAHASALPETRKEHRFSSTSGRRPVHGRRSLNMRMMNAEQQDGRRAA